MIELLVVISIISLLSSIALASLNAARDKARIAAGRSFAAQVFRVASENASGVWDFNECSGSTAADNTRNGNAATLTNGPAWSADTYSGGGCSLSLDGVNDYAVVPDGNNFFDFGPNDDFTIALWLKTSGSPGSNKPLAKYNVDTAGAGWGLYQSTTNLFLKVGNGTSVVYESPVSGINDGKWHHVAFSVQRSGSCVKYLDGKVFGSQSCSSWAAADLSNSNPLYIGVNTTLNGNWGGLLDDIQIHKKFLVASDVERLYAVGARKHVLGMK